MKGINKILFTIFFLCFLILPLNNTEARRGCCSWHGGVCGCKCCDGTFLSSTCAPYYPSCSSSTSTSTSKTNYTDLISTYATIIRTVDGDTIEVKFPDGTIEKVRLIGIDTPETVDPRKPVECFGKEASVKMKKLVNGKVVKLERKSDKNRGGYGRLLRYVYIDDFFVNAEMIKQGYAYAYLKYPFDAALMEEFKQYEKEARENERGLWAPGVCENNQVNKLKPKSLPRVKSSTKLIWNDVYFYYHFTPSISSKRVYKIKNNPTVWELSHWLPTGYGTRKAFGNPKSFLSRGYKWLDIKLISQEELEKYKKIYYSY